MHTTISSPPVAPQLNLRWLRAALLTDAVVTGANGLAYVLGATLLTDLLGPPKAFLHGIGVFLTCFAMVICVVGRRPSIPTAGVWFAIVMNTAWVVASVMYVIAADWLTTAGIVWTALQALVVLGFGLAQLVGLRRASS